MDSLTPNLGATVTSNGVFYRVWAPKTRRVEAKIQRVSTNTTHTLPFTPDKDGYHTALDSEGRAGDAYLYYLDGNGGFPDPASRAQQVDVYSASLVIDPSPFQWNDTSWKRPPFRNLVIYELHIGAFTPEGTFLAARDRLPYLKDLGVTAIEIMPIADFPGQRNWGYDGVLIYAPARCYGSPDDFRKLVDTAHQLGLAVILDVVYNHFGPDGNCLSQFSPYYFNDRHHTPWGSAINFDGREATAVRHFFTNNPIYWMNEFHIDGFRLDATHHIIDDSTPHILAEITQAIHARGGYAIAEDPRNESGIISPADQQGLDFDGVWADDFHHTVRVGQTHEQAAYFQNFRGSLQETISTLHHGWYFQGQLTKPSNTPRGTKCQHLPPQKFVHCISNHDQTGNNAFGKRIHELISPSAYRVLSALLCFSPYTPLLFMGQEWAASSPFLFFTDHHHELGIKVTEGRRREFASFPEFADPSARQKIPDPQHVSTFENSKLNWNELHVEKHAQHLLLYAECLRLRNEIAAFRPLSRDTWHIEELSWGAAAILFRDTENSYLLIFDLAGNHQGPLPTTTTPTALLPVCNGSPPYAPSPRSWIPLLSTEESRFGGQGCRFDASTQSIAIQEPQLTLFRSFRAF